MQLIPKMIRFPEDHIERIDELRNSEDVSQWVRAVLRPFLTGELVAVFNDAGEVVEVIDGEEIVTLSTVSRPGWPSHRTNSDAAEEASVK